MKCFSIGAVLVLTVISAIGGNYYHQRFSGDARALEYYKSAHPLWRSGGTAKFPSFHLVSLDRGKHWYAVDPDRNEGEIVILGSAEEKFPGLLDHLEGMDVLKNYVLENGPITFSDDRKEVERAILEGAGFTVQEPAPIQ